MKAETSAYLEKAHRDLADARAIAEIGLATVAARTVYYAVFHAAEALIVERTGKIAKTHAGVRTLLAQLSQRHPHIDKGLITFLGQAYVYKEISDYGVDRDATVTPDDAQEAIKEAARLIDLITAALGP